MKPNRLFNLDFVRSIAIFLIIFFHYGVRIAEIVSSDVLFGNHAPAGAIGVSLFIILSGASLMHSTQKEFQVKQFFKKRFLAIFPLFYLAYICTVLAYIVILGQNPLVGKNPATFILTLIGLDGFLLYKIPNYYLIGEWYLGCIIIIYLTFPVIRYFFMLNKHLLLLASLVVSIIIYHFYNLDMPIQRFPLVRIFEFTFGMYFISIYKRGSLRSNILLSLLTLLGMVIVFRFFVTGLYSYNILSILLFVFLSSLSRLIENIVPVKMVSFLSKYSYAAFLVHHQILVQIILHFKNSINSRYTNMALFVFTSILIFCVAYILRNLLEYIKNLPANFQTNRT